MSYHAKKLNTSNLIRFNMKKVLVTGGCGFIGSSLCARLVQEGYDVTSIDNYSTGSVANHIAGVNYISCSTTDIGLQKIDTDISIIFHLGEYSRVETSFEDVETVWESNSSGTFAIINFALKHNAKLIYAGSSTKFGDIGQDSSPYAFTKAKNTELVKNYGEWFGLNYAITYFYNVYGPRELSDGKYSTLIGKYLKLYKEDKKLSVTSPGTQRRNFTHIDDTIDALILVGYYGQGDGYSICASESFSVLEVARMIGSNYEMTPEVRGNRMSAVAESSKMSELGWKQKWTLRKYISSFVNDSLQNTTS